jgi:hypothetical protein
MVKVRNAYKISVGIRSRNHYDETWGKCGYNTKLILEEHETYGLDSCGSKHGTVVTLPEHDDELLGFHIGMEFLHRSIILTVQEGVAKE